MNVMKKQKGAALIVVLSLLAVSLMIGLMSMQTSQVDERLAGNYRAAADVQMAAERAAAQGWSERASHGRDSVDMDVLSRMSWESFTNDNYLHAGEEFFSEDAVEAGCPDGVECYFRIFDSCEGDNHCIVAMAAIIDGSGRVLAESEQVFVIFRLSNDAVDIPKGPDGGVISVYSPSFFRSSASTTFRGVIAVKGEVDVNFHNRSEYEIVSRDDFDDIDVPRANADDGYVSSIDINAPNVVQDCSPGGKEYPDNIDIIYCPGPVMLSGASYHSSLNGKTVVAGGGIAAYMNSWPRSVDISFISGGAIHISSRGNRDVRGLIWAAGDIAIDSSMNFSGLIWHEGYYTSGEQGIEISSNFYFEADPSVLDSIPDLSSSNGGGSPDIMGWQ